MGKAHKASGVGHIGDEVRERITHGTKRGE